MGAGKGGRGKRKDSRHPLSIRNCNDILDVDEVALILGVSDKTVYKLIRKKRIRIFTSGRAFRIRKEWLIEYMERGD